MINAVILCTSASGYSIEIIKENEDSFSNLYSCDFFGEALEENIDFAMQTYEPDCVMIYGNQLLVEYVEKVVRNNNIENIIVKYPSF